VNTAVFKAFLYDTLTSLATAGAAWLTIAANVEKMGAADYLVPIITGVAGGIIVALRRYNIIKSGK
jgi:ABC-type transporter Mla maintaining outer membrane lipid asymmetry permease subunit MlaE